VSVELCVREDNLLRSERRRQEILEKDQMFHVEQLVSEIIASGMFHVEHVY